MSYKDFQRTLRESSAYRTAGDDTRRPIDLLLGRFDWWFHLGALGIYLRGCIDASFGKYDDYGWTDSSYRFLRLYEACGARINLCGAEHLATKPAVVVANHMSMAETLILPSMLLAFGGLTIVVKRTLTRYPFFGTILSATNPIRVSRSNAREDLRTVMQLGAESLGRGRSVILFPQHTRNPRFDPKIFNSIGVKLAARTGVPLIPIALKTDFHGIGRLVKDMGQMDRTKEMYFRVGEPLVIDQNEKEVQRKVIAFISESLLSWGGEVADGSEGSKQNTGQATRNMKRIEQIGDPGGECREGNEVDEVDE